ncbi:hypothetical protein UlMin_040920 [Ulmus minor]
MALLIPEQVSHKISLPLGIFLFVSISAFIVGLCAKHIRLRKRSEAKSSDQSTTEANQQSVSSFNSDKEFPFFFNKKSSDGGEVETSFGSGGDESLWRRTILMGDKCRPPEFSGVIYYDSCGNRLSHMPPRSPRASPLPGFSFPVAKDSN